MYSICVFGLSKLVSGKCQDAEAWVYAFNAARDIASGKPPGGQAGEVSFAVLCEFRIWGLGFNSTPKVCRIILFWALCRALRRTFSELLVCLDSRSINLSANLGALLLGAFSG